MRIVWRITTYPRGRLPQLFADSLQQPLFRTAGVDE
jgi:hypothetical protein